MSISKQILLQLFLLYQSWAFSGQTNFRPKSNVSARLLGSFSEYFSNSNANPSKNFLDPRPSNICECDCTQDYSCVQRKENASSITLDQHQGIVVFMESEGKTAMKESDSRQKVKDNLGTQMTLQEITLGSIVVSIIVGSTIAPREMHSFITSTLIASIPYLSNPENPMMMFLFDKLFPIIWESMQKIVLMGVWRRVWKFSCGFVQNLRSKYNPNWNMQIMSLNEFINRSARRLVIRHVERKVQSIFGWIRKVVEDKRNDLYDTFVQPLMDIST